MGLINMGKNAEDKTLEKLATYLDNMDLQEKDGTVHAARSSWRAALVARSRPASSTACWSSCRSKATK